MSHVVWDYPVAIVFVGWVWSRLLGAGRAWAGPVFVACLALAAVLAFDSFNREAPVEDKLAQYYKAWSIPASPPLLGP
jgi:hypothetical protein